jgi:hypothetical protein
VSRIAGRRRLRHHDHRVAAVQFRDHHIDPLIPAKVNALPNDIGVDRQLATAPVDEHRQSDARRATEVRQLVERGADRPASVQHVVHDHDSRIVDVARDVGGADDRARTDGLEVVTVERDVECAAARGLALAFRDQSREPLRKLYSASLDADEDEIFGAGVEFDNLIRHAAERSVHGARVEQDRRLRL